VGGDVLAQRHRHDPRIDQDRAGEGGEPHATGTSALERQRAEQDVGEQADHLRRDPAGAEGVLPDHYRQRDRRQQQRAVDEVRQEPRQAVLQQGVAGEHPGAAQQEAGGAQHDAGHMQVLDQVVHPRS